MAPIGVDHINVIFTRVTDMRHIDACFRDRRRTTFENICKTRMIAAELLTEATCACSASTVGHALSRAT